MYRLFFLFILFFNLYPEIVYAEINGCNPVWSIENIEIDEKNINPSKAKNDAERNATLSAFKSLLDRIVVTPLGETEIAYPSIENEIIESMVNFKLVKNETTLSNRYLANLSFCFIPDKVANYLVMNNFSWSELTSRPIIILPVWQNKFGSRLWRDPNPWKNAFIENIELHNGLSNLIIPINRIGVERSIDSKLALMQDRSSISRAIKRGGATRALIAIAEIKENEMSNLNSLNIKVLLFNENGDNQGLLYEKNTFIDISKLSQLLIEESQEIISSMEMRWKQANIFDGKLVSEITVFINANNAFEWVNGKRKLENLPGVKKIRTESINNNGGYVRLWVMGGVQRLVSIITEKNLPVSGSRENLIFNAGKL